MQNDETTPPIQTPPASDQIAPEPAQPPVIPPPDTVNGQSVSPSPVQPAAKSGRKLIYVMLIILVAALAAGTGFYVVNHKNPASPAASTGGSKPKTYASAKKQYYLNDSVAGYLNFKPAAFQEAATSKLPTIPAADPGVNSVIVEGNIAGFSGAGLYLYDLTTNKTYRLTDGGGSPRIMSNHYMLYSFDTGSGAGKRLGGKLLDLQTGKTTTVFSAPPENVAGSICCSVSPDGFRAAFVQKNKISVWDIRTNKTTDYTATVNPIDPNFSRTAANDYNTENAYAQPQWLDNSTLIYTDKPADSPVPNQPANIVNTGLFQLDTDTGKSQQIKTDDGGIYDIYVANNTIFYDQAALTGFSGNTQIYIVDTVPAHNNNQGPYGRPLGYNPGFVLISPDGKKVYTFDTMDSGTAYTVLDPYASDPSKASETFNPHITGTPASQIYPRGWIDNDRMLITLLDTAGTQNHEYIGVYNVKAGKVEQYVSVQSKG